MPKLQQHARSLHRIYTTEIKLHFYFFYFYKSPTKRIAQTLSIESTQNLKKMYTVYEENLGGTEGWGGGGEGKGVPGKWGGGVRGGGV